MPTRLSFSFYGDQQIDRTLADIDDRVTDLRPLWDTLADRFAALEQRQFSSEGAYGSGGWTALSPRYAVWKARHYPGKTILRRTDELYASLTERPLGIEIIEARFAVFGSDVPHGGYHQKGDGVPQRRPVELPETERIEWARAAQRFLMTGDR